MVVSCSVVMDSVVEVVVLESVVDRLGVVVVSVAITVVSAVSFPVVVWVTCVLVTTTDSVVGLSVNLSVVVSFVEVISSVDEVITEFVVVSMSGALILVVPVKDVVVVPG